MKNLPEHDLASSTSTTEGLEAVVSGGEPNATENQSSKRRKNNDHQHTALQTQELEAAFKRNRNLNDRVKLDLVNRLGLTTQQVTFWFQNRRFQEKTNIERRENYVMQQENEKLQVENFILKEAMKNPPCSACGVPTTPHDGVDLHIHDLIVQNDWFKSELERLHSLKSGRTSSPPSTPPFQKPGFGLGQSGLKGSPGTGYENSAPTASLEVPTGANVPPVDKSAALVELAKSAMDELIKLTRVGGPMWLTSSQGTGELLNVEEYKKAFPLAKHCDHLVSDGTRASATVMLETSALLQNLMDADRWKTMFPLYIGRASTIDVISTGTPGTGKDGVMNLMQAQFQVPSPLMPVRKAKFVRFCKQIANDTWAVVDVSVDTLPDSVAAGKVPFWYSRRFPSGCVVQSLPNDHSKVTWVEHTEYDENSSHQVFWPLGIRSGMAYGAHNWVSFLQRRYEIFHAVLQSVPSGGDNSVCTQIGRMGITTLAMRMMSSFATSICCTAHKWKFLQNDDSARFTFRASNGPPEEPAGMILSAVHTVWLPVQPQNLFDFLKNEHNRVLWDNASPTQKLWQSPRTDQDPDNNNVSVLCGNAGPEKNQQVMVLQDTWKDAFGSYFVSATMDAASFVRVLNGFDSGCVAILPSGFVILPVCVAPAANGGEGSSTAEERQFGAYLHCGFQMVLESGGPASKPSEEDVERMKKLINDTINGIKTGLNI